MWTWTWRIVWPESAPSTKLNEYLGQFYLAWERSVSQLGNVFLGRCQSLGLSSINQKLLLQTALGTSLLVGQELPKCVLGKLGKGSFVATWDARLQIHNSSWQPFLGGVEHLGQLGFELAKHEGSSHSKWDGKKYYSNRFICPKIYASVCSRTTYPWGSRAVTTSWRPTWLPSFKISLQTPTRMRIWLKGTTNHFQVRLSCLPLQAVHLKRCGLN